MHCSQFHILIVRIAWTYRRARMSEWICESFNDFSNARENETRDMHESSWKLNFHFSSYENSQLSRSCRTFRVINLNFYQSSSLYAVNYLRVKDEKSLIVAGYLSLSWAELKKDSIIHEWLCDFFQVSFITSRSNLLFIPARLCRL